MQIYRFCHCAAVCINLLQNSPAFHICAIFKGSQISFRICQCNGNRDICGCPGRHCHQIISIIGGIGVRQRNRSLGGDCIFLSCIACIGSGIVHQDDRSGLIIQRFGSRIVDSKAQRVNAGPVRIVLQLQLGAGHTRYRDIALCIDRLIDTHKARTLLPGRSGITIITGNDDSSTHQQSVYQILQIFSRHLRESGFQCLLHNCHTACYVRRSHGGSIHHFVSIAGNCRIDAAARGSQFRLQSQFTGRTPGREIRHTGNWRIDKLICTADRQHLVFLLLHIFACILGDEHSRHTPIQNGHIQHSRDVVINDHRNGARSVGITHLLLVIQATATADKSDLTCYIHLRKILGCTIAGNYHIGNLSTGSHGAQSCTAFGVGSTIVVCQFTAVNRDIGAESLAVGSSCHRQGFMICRRLTDQTVFRIGGQRTIAKRVTIRRTVSIACSNSHRNTVLSDPIKYSQQIIGPFICRIVIDISAVCAQAQIDYIHIQQNAVFKRAQNIAVGGTAGFLKYVHVDDLSFRGHTYNRFIYTSIACCRSSNVGTMITAGTAICILAAIVKLERNLGAVVQGSRTHAGDDTLSLKIVCIQQHLNIRLGQSRILRCVSENLVTHIHTRIQNSNGHTFAIESGVVIQATTNHLAAACSCRYQFKSRRKEHRRNTVQIFDYFILRIGYSSRKAIKQRGKTPFQF